MHKYAPDKFKWNPNATFETLPLPELSTLDCPQCRYRIVVPEEYTDWKHVAGLYKEAYETMNKRFMELLREAGEQFDVPFVEYVETERQLLMAMLTEILNRAKEQP